MKVRNPSYDRAQRQGRGSTAALRAGPRGWTLRDSDGNEVHPTTDVLVVGGTVTDEDDGTAILTVGSGSGSSTFGDSGGMVPYYIPSFETFTVPLHKQGLFYYPIEVDGALIVNGILQGVD